MMLLKRKSDFLVGKLVLIELVTLCMVSEILRREYSCCNIIADGRGGCKLLYHLHPTICGKSFQLSVRLT